MDGMVLEVGVPVIVPNIEIICHDNHTFQINDSLMQKMQGSLIAVRIDVNNEVNVTVRIEDQNIDVSVVDNVEAQSKSKL